MDHLVNSISRKSVQEKQTEYNLTSVSGVGIRIKEEEDGGK